ncbi:MAG: pentapeptide repeat-containing protein [Lachnospiraceae bacterium]|nr:pentapeptide repeat-containing protein [Lachnospiraceae bacterium]
MNEVKSQYDDIFIKEAKLNFQVFNKLELEAKDLSLLHLISSAISIGHFKSVCFYNASFFSTKFSKVSFINCNLKSTDICSIWANNCKFQNVNFSGATISDSTFINCIFNDSIFESVSLTRCQFVNCIFDKFSVEDSTFVLNTFTCCKIKYSHFTESFYYQIFDNCTFYKVIMEPLLLGFNFGFSSKTFAQLTKGVDLITINSDFIKKGLYINAAILRINQIQNYYDEAMIACVASLGQMIQHDILIKADEVEFLKNLTKYFQERKQITPISILRIWQLINTILSNNSYNISSTKAMPYITEYANMLYFNFINFQQELQKRLEQLPKTSNILDTAELKIVYLERPTFPLLDLLTEFSSIADLDCPAPNLICTEKGSFHEYHNIAIMIIPYLQTFLALLGVTVPIIVYKKQKKDHENEEQVKKAEQKTTEIELTLATRGIKQSPILLPNTNITTDTNTIILDVTKILERKPEIYNMDYCGYNSLNIESITIRFH